MLVVELVERRDEALLTAVGLVVLREEVLDALVVAPLDVLGDLVAHEVELAARVRDLVEGERAHARELTPEVAGHTGDERALAVDDLVMRQREDEVLVELVHRRERDLAVVAGAPGEVGLHVVQGVVHPAHVPLEVEAQAADLRRAGDERPRGRLLGDHHDVGVVLPDHLVALADERDGHVVLLGATRVELLLTWVIHAEVEIEHARDAIHADAVGVVLLDPVDEVGDEEGANLAAGEVELVGAPVGVNLVLVEHLAVEAGKAVLVGAEPAGHPVEDDADAGRMARVDEVHELGRLAIARGRGVVAGGLVAPGAVKGMLHDRHELDVGVAHLADVVDELLGKVVVAVVGPSLSWERIARSGPGAVRARLALRLVSVPLPAAQMHLEDVERTLADVRLGTGVEPRPVLPGVGVDLGGTRGGAARHLGVEGVGVGLVELAPVLELEEILVELAELGAGNKALPDAAGGRLLERARGLVPAVEVADDVHAADVRRPDGKVEALDAVIVHDGVGAHLLEAPVPLALGEKVQVVVAEIQGIVMRVHDRSYEFPGPFVTDRLPGIT